MSHLQKKASEGGTPAERRGSKQESDFKGEILKMFAEIKSDIKQSERNIETKVEQMDKRIGQVDKKIDVTVNELKGQLKEVSRRTQTLEEGMKRTKSEMKEMRKEEEKIKTGMSEMNKSQEEVWDAIAMNELRQRKVNLRLRSVPETQGENIKEKLITEIAQWLELQTEEMAKTVQNAFRMKVRTTKARKFPGDYIPIRLLKRRDPYKPMVQILKKNKIEFKWEYPEGISFFYKSKRHRHTSPEETSKFLRRYKELRADDEEARDAELGMEAAGGRDLEEREEINMRGGWITYGELIVKEGGKWKTRPYEEVKEFVYDWLHY
uniref:L1 transposable element RRM domain-containing protein n=1 Tax=Podarcis muralis TaxID=64176 RepID=A0A670HLT9_PODMU